MVKELIEQAKNKYPVSIHYKGRLSEEESIELRKSCDVHCPTVYMDGSAIYSIRWKGYSIDEKRMENLLIDAISWAEDTSGQITHDLLRGMGITSDELEYLGYDKETFPEMHKWVEE